MAKIYAWASSGDVPLEAMGVLENETNQLPDGTFESFPEPIYFMDGECLKGSPWPEKVGGPLRAHFEHLPLEKVLVWDYLDVLNCFTPVVSPKLRRVLEEVAGADVQFFPITLIGNDGKTNEDYSVLNVCVMVQAIDEERCVIKERLPRYPGEEEDPCDHPGYWRVAFVEGDPLRGHHIARQAAPETSTIWGSETLKRAVEEVGCRGVDFKDPNEIISSLYYLDKIFGERYGVDAHEGEASTEGYTKLDDVVATFERLGWEPGATAGAPYVLRDLSDRRLRMYLELYGKETPSLIVWPYVSSPEFDALVERISGEPHPLTPLVGLIFWGYNETVVPPPITEDVITETSDKLIAWARSQDLNAAKEFLRTKVRPTCAGVLHFSHLAALAEAGDVEKLQTYADAFARGDRLGFSSYITDAHIARALEIAQECAARQNA